MTPMSALSSSAYGILMTSAGRTFWVMPKSTCQTSPRSGTLRVLLCIERAEHFGCQGGEILVRQVVGHRNALHNGAAQFDALRGRQLLDLSEDVGNGLSHGGNLSVA